MKITNVLIENFRSIKKIEFKPNLGLNAFIGGNSSGKSNIFDAINWLLGPIYPSFNSVKKEDYFKGDNTQKIKIKLTFDDGNYLELAEEWLDRYGNLKSGLNLSGGYCTDELRKKYCCAYVGVEREILDYLPSNKWSLMGRVLQEINNRFIEEKVEGTTTLKSKKLREDLDIIRDQLLFSVKDQQGNNIMNEFLRILREESSKQLNCAESDFNINLNLYDPWNFYKTLQILVKERDIGVEFQASQLGMGFQASLTIAILKAYTKLKLRNQCPIFIDEPELFLHPHAQKNFYSILRDLAESGIQVFYTTHSSNFLSVGNFDEIFIVRKGSDGTYIKFSDVNRFVTDFKVRTGIDTDGESIKLYYMNSYENTGDSKSANEAFFAKKIILVEGHSESLLLPYLFKKLNFDFIKDGLSIVCCGSKVEIDRFLRLYSEFGIPCFVIFDGDKQFDSEPQKRTVSISRNKKLFSILDQEYTGDYPDNQVKSNYFGFEYRFEDNLNFTTTKKGLNLYREARKKYETEQIVIPTWLSELIPKVKELPSETQSILLEPATPPITQ